MVTHSNFPLSDICASHSSVSNDMEVLYYQKDWWVRNFYVHALWDFPFAQEKNNLRAVC